jgi:hypothetical protein
VLPQAIQDLLVEASASHRPQRVGHHTRLAEAAHWLSQSGKTPS